MDNSSLLGEAAKIVSDTSILRRLLFAASTLHEDIPEYWNVVTKFATEKSTSCTDLKPEQAALLVDNIMFTDPEVMTPDLELYKELAMMPFKEKEHFGVNLISEKDRCIECGGKLLLRKDRPGKLKIYSDTYGTLPGYHYRKLCANSKRGCKVVQHYGYYTKGPVDLHYDKDWSTHKYFVSTQETAFELQLLWRFDTELLIGQISYKQRAEIYNATHGYESAKKRCSMNDKESDSENVEDDSEL